MKTVGGGMPSLSLSLPPSLKAPLTHRNAEALPYSKQDNKLDRYPTRSFSVPHLRKAITTLDLARAPHESRTDPSLLLKACIRSRSFDLGKLLHRKLTESGLVLDSVLLNSLITLYSKCGEWEQALSIFEKMDNNKRDLVSWSAMISCFANHNMEREALATFLDMLRNGLYPNEYCFTASLRSCSNAQHFSTGLAIFGFVLKTGYFESDVCVGCALTDMFAKGGSDAISAFKVFEKMPERNVVTWNLMITRLVQLGSSSDAIDLFFSMLLSGFTSDRFTISALLTACAELALLSLGKQLHSLVIRSGIGLDVCVGCSLLDMYAKCAADGSVESSRRVFDRMPEHNVIAWTALISAYVQGSGQEREAIRLFGDMMIRGNVAPNCFTFSGVLKACANLPDSEFGEQLHGQTIKLGISAVNCVGNSLVNMYARSGRMECAGKSFDVLFENNLVSHNAVADPNAKNLNSEDAFTLEIEGAGIGSNSFTYACLLSAAASIGTISKGEQVHAKVVKSGFGTNLCINNSLVSMYSKCGNKEAALQVFNDIRDPNVISWTSIINGFAKHGFAKKALELFHEMLETGVKPNEVTYIAVLSACSHVGLIDEAWKHFTSMRRDHGVVPRMEHYACMVDLLGRSGLLLEAFEFINSMPFCADALVWRTFLGSCRVHHNTELGEHAAKMILELEPHDSAAYILLSNLYASEGRWDDVGAIRKRMKQKKLIKEAGYSWIEVENQVHRFHVGDTTHPQAQKIYDKLDELALEIKNLGYVPDTDFVLHDVEDEQKEHFLFQHSEKIAVAFALISTPKPKPIRVFKNLRVCGDCHMAIKYISKVTGREIVVRDANRFHHMKDGECSCNDYW